MFAEGVEFPRKQNCVTRVTTSTQTKLRDSRDNFSSTRQVAAWSLAKPWAPLAVNMRLNHFIVRLPVVKDLEIHCNVRLSEQ